MKYYKFIGIATCILLITACFLPWTYHADINENFSGFYSRNNEYGKPGKITVFFAVASILLIATNRIWAKRVHLFVTGLLVAFTIRNYIVFTTCYFGYCPERKYGLYLLLFSVVLMIVVAVLPDVKLDSKTDDRQPATND